MPKLTNLWHEDADGKCRPNDFVGNKYFHPKTGHLYEVIDYGIDAQRELWLLHYIRIGDNASEREFTFHHTIADFTREGRFLEVT